MTKRTPTLIVRTPGMAARVMLWVALALAFIAAAPVARAADAGVASGASISPQYFAPRFLPNSDTTAPAHLYDFSPLSINYADCVTQIDLEFSLDLTDAPPGDEIQAWAGSGAADCTQTSARTFTPNDSPSTFPGRCWPVTPPGAFSTATSPSTYRVSVLDLVAHIGDDDPPVTFTKTESTSVCKPVGTRSAVPLNIYFMFVPSGSGRGTVAAAPPDGIPGLYQTPAALVGPFAPTGVSAPNSGITATSLTVSWIPQDEAIIQGYNIYVDNQGPDGGLAKKVSADSGATLLYNVECHPALPCIPDAGKPKEAGKDAKHDADKDAGHDATVMMVVDAGVDTGIDAEAGEEEAGPTEEECDAGLADVWVPEDAAAFEGEDDAALAEQGCELTVANTQKTMSNIGSLVCNSAVLVDEFTVDGGPGSAVSTLSDAAAASTLLTTVSTDSGADAADSGVDSGVISLAGTSATITETAGISYIPGSHLAFYSTGSTSNSYTITGLTTGNQYAIGVAAVDSYGNVGPLGLAINPYTGNPSGGIVACSIPTPVKDFFTLYGMDGGTAGGGFCALTAIGSPAPFFASVFGAGVLGAAIGRGRRRRRERMRS